MSVGKYKLQWQGHDAIIFGSVQLLHVSFIVL